MLSGYRITTAKDTKTFPGRNPKTWSLFGSNKQSEVPDDTCWKLLDRRENDTTLGATNYTPYDFYFSFSYPEPEPDDDIIIFADAEVKAICVANWDTNGSGELCMSEAAAVTSLGSAFSGNAEITSFDELQYFTGLTSLNSTAFSGCSALRSVIIPENLTSVGSQAFKDCIGLEQILCNAQEPPEALQNTFEQVNVKNVMLVVPDDAEPLYRAHPVWGQFWIETPSDIIAVPAVREDEPVYDLSGRRRNTLRNGLYIKGGKKILKK